MDILVVLVVAICIAMYVERKQKMSKKPDGEKNKFDWITNLLLALHK